MMQEWPLPVKILQYMRQNPGMAFTVEDIADKFDCSIGRARGALRRLAEVELLLQTQTISGNTTYSLDAYRSRPSYGDEVSTRPASHPR